MPETIDSISEHEALQSLVKKKDVYTLAKGMSGFQPSETQQRIMRKIVFQECEDLIVVAPTRWGKTKTIAEAIGMRFALTDNLTVNEIAPVQDQTKKFRQYLLNFSVQCDLLNVADTRGTSVEELMKEANQYHIDFTDNNAINFLTAGGSDDAKGMMGEGADIIMVDESHDVTDAVYEKRVFRQAEVDEQKDWSQEIHIGNPWSKTNHFYDHWTDPDFVKIHVKLEDALREGRTTEKKIEKGRRRLSPTRFKVLYEAEFPDQLQDALISYRWLDNPDGEIPGAVQNHFDWTSMADTPEEFMNGVSVGYGWDIAGEGDDMIVLIRGEKFRDKWRVTDLWDRAYSNNTTKLARWGMRKIKARNELDRAKVVVDAVGIGSGVWSTLRDEGVYSIKFKAGESPPHKNSDKANKKSYYYWKLRDILEARDMDLPDPKKKTEFKPVFTELTQLVEERTNRDKERVTEPDDNQSFDYADALMMLTAMDSGIYIGGAGGKTS